MVGGCRGDGVGVDGAGVAMTNGPLGHQSMSARWLGAVP